MTAIRPAPDIELEESKIMSEQKKNNEVDPERIVDEAIAKLKVVMEETPEEILSFKDLAEFTKKCEYLQQAARSQKENFRFNRDVLVAWMVEQWADQLPDSIEVDAVCLSILREAAEEQFTELLQQMENFKNSAPRVIAFCDQLIAKVKDKESEYGKISNDDD